jgi:hypothetical protein
MSLKVDSKNAIDLKEFQLGWRWDKSHNNEISLEEKKLITALNSLESKRLYNAIQHYSSSTYLRENFSESTWLSANSESSKHVQKFKEILHKNLFQWNENLIISWDRSTAIQTTKEMFIKYWDDFLYPSSDNAIIISEELNWIIEYNHIEVANIWLKK